jgi:hypothetical protein
MLLIIIGLAGSVYFAQWFIPWYLKKTAPDPDLRDDLPPWKEWRIREKSEKPPGELSDIQPDISNQLGYDTNARLAETNDHRGEVSFSIYPDGTVAGGWHGQYYSLQKFNCAIQGSGFSGRVYPAKIYRDENGEDPSKLYFLAKGEFSFQETNFDTGVFHIRGGDIYATGWISPDYTAEGKIIITSDEKYSHTFIWESQRPVR